MAEWLDQVVGQPLEDGYREQVVHFMSELIPFNRHLGMSCTLLVKGRARLRIPARPEFTGDPFRPALHGGVISTLADTVGGLVVFSLMEPQDRCSTIDLRVDYLRPGRVNTPLDAEGEIIRLGNRVAVVSVTVFQDEDRSHPVAVAKGVYGMRRAREAEPPAQDGSGPAS